MENANTVKDKSEITEIKAYRTHTNPDPDAAGGIWLLRRFSHIKGAHTATIDFVSQETKGESTEELEKQGIICIDTGEGRFDHHPHGSKPGKCAMDLVADYLGLSDDPAIQRILDFIRMHDLEGPKSLSRRMREQNLDSNLIGKVSLLEDFSLVPILNGFVEWLKNFAKTKYGAKVILVLLQIFKIDINSENVIEKLYIEIVSTVLHTVYKTQKRFWTKTKQEFLNKAKYLIAQREGKKYYVAVIESPMKNTGGFSRTKDGGNCDACIQRDSNTGYVFISGNLTHEQFTGIAERLRVQEMLTRNISIPYLLSDISDSKFNPCTIWYLPKDKEGKAFIVMNGGDKATEVEHTILSIEQIAAVVRDELEDKIFEDCPHTYCLDQNYDSQFHLHPESKPQCPFYCIGLDICNKIRKA
jgi:hypothetical protein